MPIKEKKTLSNLVPYTFLYECLMESHKVSFMNFKPTMKAHNGEPFVLEKRESNIIWNKIALIESLTLYPASY